MRKKSFPPKGTLLEDWGRGFDRILVFADGNGGTYTEHETSEPKPKGHAKKLSAGTYTYRGFRMENKGHKWEATGENGVALHEACKRYLMLRIDEYLDEERR